MKNTQKITQKTIREVLSPEKWALVGVSTAGNKFSNMAYKEISKKGKTLYAVNPKADNIGSVPCYRNLKSLPEAVGTAIVMVPSAQALGVVQDACEAGIHNIWLQQGSDSPEALAFCRGKKLNVVAGECILMFAEPVGTLHKIHRLIWKLIGRYPR